MAKCIKLKNKKSGRVVKLCKAPQLRKIRGPRRKNKLNMLT